MRAKFFRTKYLTGSHVQMMYLRLLMLSMVIPLVIVGACLYYLMFTLVASQIGIPEYVAYHLSPVVKRINYILIIGVPPLLLLLLLWGIALSHRFAGPMERLEAELKNMVDNRDFKHRIHLRKSDNVKPLADAVNRLLDAMEGKHK
jgi:HAMP domain-containing protein